MTHYRELFKEKQIKYF